MWGFIQAAVSIRNKSAEETMKTLLEKFSDLVGRTIDKVHVRDDELWLSFTDGTAAIIEQGRTYYAGETADLELCTDVSEYEKLNDASIAIALLSDDEMYEQEARQERALFEKLKKKYESQ
jgi:hypothetical protein